MSAKKKYINYCKENYIPLFFQPFWLAASSFEWEVLYIEHEGYEAFWIYHLQKKLGFSFIRNPHLTPYTGFILCNESTPQLIQEKMALSLLQQLPAVDVLEIDLSFSVQCNPSFLKFEESFRHTNILNLSPKELVFANFKPAVKRQIRKAEKSLSIFEKDDIELFYFLHKKTFLKNNLKPSISFEVMQNYWDVCKENQCGKLLFIQDEHRQIHAALWLVYDKDYAYYLAGGTDASYYGSGAMSKLMWHVIELSIALNKIFFDFEGSQIASIDRFFKNFSPREVSYKHLKKINSLIYKLIKGNENPE